MPTYKFEATAYVPPQAAASTRHSSNKPAQRLSAAPFASTASTASNAFSTSSASPAFSSFTASFPSSASLPLTTAALDSPIDSTRVLVTGRLSPTKDRRDSSHSKSSKQQHTSSSTTSSRGIDGGDHKQRAAQSSSTSGEPVDELDSVAALDELWNAYQHEKSRAASLHTALESLTIKHTQLQTAHATALRTVDTLQQRAHHHSTTAQQLQHAIDELQSDKQSMKRGHSQYRHEVYQQIEQLKRDFIATQHNYEATLHFYKQGGEGRQHELDAMKRKLAAYKRQMGEGNGGGYTASESEVAKGPTKQAEEEKQQSTPSKGDEDSGDGVVDFHAEVEIRRASKGPIDSTVKQLTLGKSSAVTARKSGDSGRFHSSRSTDSCDECEQEI